MVKRMLSIASKIELQQIMKKPLKTVREEWEQCLGDIGNGM